jgi:hypothetical protein
MNARDVMWYAGMAAASGIGVWVAYREPNALLAVLALLVAAQAAYIYTLERRLEA